MPRARGNTTKTTNKKKLVVADRHCTFHLERKAVRTNSKGTDYIAINLKEHGYNEPVAIYANIDEIEVGKIYTLVQFEPMKKGETGMLALNEPTAKERLKYLQSLKNEFEGMSISEIKEGLGIIS